MMGKHLGVQCMVQYVYAAVGDQDSAPQLTPAALAALPPELLDKLVQAIEHLDDDMIQQSLEVLRRHAGSLADALTAVVQRFDYDPIITWIQKTPSGSRQQ